MRMVRSEIPRPDLRVLLDRAEAASPVEAVDVLADELAAVLNASEVCFLLTDLTGRAVARFGGTAANAARQQQGVPGTLRSCSWRARCTSACYGLSNRTCAGLAKVRV